MQNQPAIVLPRGQKIKVQVGTIFLMFSIAMFGLSLNTLQGPMLESLNAMNYFSLVSLLSVLGLTIMTPIGGKIGDLVGRRNLVLVSGIISLICAIGIGFSNSFAPFVVFRFLLGAAMGAYVSTPYIIAREINEPKDVPKAMGLIGSGAAVGGMLGSLIAGALMDAGKLRLAITFPVVPLIIGVILVVFNLPNNKAEGKVKLDVAGIIMLAISLSLILIAINFAPIYGLTDIKVLAGLIVGLIAGYFFIKVENKAAEPIVPLRLLKNKNYVKLLIIGFIGYFYMNAMNIYAPLATISVLGEPTTMAGVLQLPRTVITMVLPILAGTWVAKDRKNHKVAMIIATLLVAIPMFVMATTKPTTSVYLLIAMLAITGIAESFRAVSVTTMAQTCLEQKDLGIGTALVNFINSTASLISASIFGIAYDLKTRANPNDMVNIMEGTNAVYLIAGVVSVIGLLIVLFATKGIFDETSNVE